MGGCIKKTHGMTKTPEYKAWSDMMRRCRNPKSDNWKYYGGRGIEIRFASFEEFFAAVGPRPTPKHSIDRWPNNDSHYEAGNVRWATRSQQQRNKRLGSEYCQRGHKFTAGNTYLRKDGKRHCKECTRLRDQKRLPDRNAQKNMSRAAQRYAKRFGGVVLFNGVPPLIPHDSLPVRWPVNAETALLLAQKASEIQGSRPN